MLSRNDPCWCGSGQKWKKCHYPALPQETSFEKLKNEYQKKYRITLKTPEQIEGIRHACKIAAKMLKTLSSAAKPGVTTQELDDLSRKLHAEYNATPAPLGYGHPPYKKTICTSLNEVICHGIPNSKCVLQTGDIINIDVSPIVNGYFGDCSAMVMIGEVSDERKRVVQTSYDCLMESIAPLKPGTLLCDIGNTITRVAHQNHCSVVYQFVGHGVGLRFHEEPEVRHHANNVKIPLAEGMIFTIEPMINAGLPEAVVDPTDHWTARTIDGKASAQWEHTILITSTGHEILTLSE